MESVNNEEEKVHSNATNKLKKYKLMVNEQDNYINDIEHQLIKLFQINNKNKHNNHNYRQLI